MEIGVIRIIFMQYLDPGAGSYAFQLLIAGFSAVAFFFSYKMKDVLLRFFRPKKNDKPQ